SSGQRLYGLSITAVNSNGPAAEAGLQVGDILLKISGKPFSSVQQALNMIAETAPNSELALTIDRSGQIITMNATVRELRRYITGLKPRLLFQCLRRGVSACALFVHCYG